MPGLNSPLRQPDDMNPMAHLCGFVIGTTQERAQALHQWLYMGHEQTSSIHMRQQMLHGQQRMNLAG